MNKVSVQNFVRNYSIETTILEATRVGRFPDIVLPGTRIYIPQTPSTQFKDTIALAARLRRESMEPVPHVVARIYDPANPDPETFSDLLIKSFSHLAIRDSALRAKSQGTSQQIAPTDKGNSGRNINREKSDVSRGRQLY